MEMFKKDIQYVKGVGPKRLSMLKKLNIHNVEDMLYHFPRDYDNRSISKKIIELQPNDKVTIYGEIAGSCQISKVRKGLNISSFLLKDDTGYLTITFFNQPYIKSKFKLKDKIMVNGKVKMGMKGKEIVNPVYEIIDTDAKAELNGIVPIYPATEGFLQSQIMNIQKNALQCCGGNIIDYIPDDIRQKNKLCDLNYALKNIHFPTSVQQLKVAKYRLVFEELLLLQLRLMSIKKSFVEDKTSIALKKENKKIEDFILSLPFKLTDAQKTVLQEIQVDLEKNVPMNRLIQGDVGSGKTIVAIIALYKAIVNGYQGALMAPTEILAEQHYVSLTELLEPLGIRIGLLIGSLKKSAKTQLIKEIEEGKIDIVIGTHALIQDTVYFKNLALVVTDEQHRFGVRQRAVLASKGNNPHILVMTATPIPRTLALILYGDLDISIIDQLPPGRKKIKTYSRALTEKERVYTFVEKELKLGRQAYVVCPLVEESEAIEAKAATEIAEELSATYFSNYKVGLLHGKMRPKEKEEVMKSFVNNELHVLVSTTVIEVGVNVPNSTVMVIENAERFGLAQLHQLRGRVGRGNSQSYCILLHNNKSKVAKARMDIMEATTDGFVISEKDLEIRGPGEFFGIRQHGLPDLKIANLFKHMKVLKKVQGQVEELLINDPHLTLAKYPLLKQKVEEKFTEFEGA